MLTDKLIGRTNRHIQSGRERRFDLAHRSIEGRAQPVQIISCGNCTQEGFLNCPANGLPDAVVSKKFQQREWKIGARRRDDRCPRCQELEREASRRPNPQLATALANARGKQEHDTFMAHTTPPPTTVTPIRPSVEIDAPTKPREMQRSDRQIIISKLMDVYIDEKQGYASPWTDLKVAEDLGVPRAWVEKLRDENFGPARDNEEIREMLANCNTVLELAEKRLAEARELWAKANALNADIAEGRRAVEALQKQAERIAKAVAA